MIRQLVSVLTLSSTLGLAAVAHAQDVLTLDAAMDVLDEQNLDLASAEVSIQQAEHARRQALALLRPTVSAAGTYTYRNEEIEFAQGNIYAPLEPYLQVAYEAAGGENSPLPDPTLLTRAESEPMVVQYQHDISGSLSIDQSLYNARALPFIRQARIGIRQAENGEELVRYQLQGAVTQLYFAAVLQQRLVDVSERNVSLARLSWERASIAREEQVGTQFEVNRAQVELSRAERELENARTSYAITIRNLSTLLNTDAPFDVTAPPVYEVPTSAPVVDPERPEVLAHDLQLEMHDERLAETRGQWLPSVFAHGQMNFARATAFGGDRVTWFIQLGATWELYDGGVRTNERRVRETERIAEELAREATLREIQTQIDATALEIAQLQRDVESAQADRELAEENLELTDAAFELGVATQIDTQLAREQLFASELALATAEVNLQAKIYEMLRLGGGEPWE